MLDRAEYDRFRVAPLDPAALRARDVEKLLKQVARGSDGRLSYEKYAESLEGRPIYLARIGTGSKRVLLWSQMHGDEPTHTAVLLDLANYLLQKPTEPYAAEILANCTLHFIPMLNPDGAEAVKRFNSQGIDINRDARRLATPEGRALRAAVESIKPEFAFNLHNQNARTSVGKPPKPAAVSVLAPAPDRSGKETPGMHRAKLMCATFVEAVRLTVSGMISRYEDDHEPRAFGDTIQATGAATMLVEAGGWSSDDIEQVTRVHFHGMLATLHAIATDAYLKADIKVYEKLPESNSARQLDCLIDNGSLVTSIAPKAFTADLGILQSRSERLGGNGKSDGKIVEIGDLSTLSARASIDATGGLILPGQLAFLEDWNAEKHLATERVNTLLLRGVTTVIGCVDLANRAAIDAIAEDRDLPVNWGFVGRLENVASVSPVQLVENVAVAGNRGLLAIATDRANEEVWQQFTDMGAAMVQLTKLRDSNASASYQELANHTAVLFAHLGLTSRGTVVRDSSADLAVFKAAHEADAESAVDWRGLDRVLVAGEIVWQNGKRAGGSPGILLGRR